MRYIYVGKKLRIGVEMLPLLCIWIREDGYAALSAVAAVILHEAAHAAAAVLCGRKITSLTLTLPGADMRCAGVCSYRAELLTFLSNELHPVKRVELLAKGVVFHVLRMMLDRTAEYLEESLYPIIIDMRSRKGGTIIRQLSASSFNKVSDAFVSAINKCICDKRADGANADRDKEYSLFVKAKKESLDVFRAKGKELQFIIPVNGPFERFSLSEDLLRFLVLSLVSPGCKMDLNLFLEKLYEHYRLVIGPNEYVRASRNSDMGKGLINSFAYNLEAFQSFLKSSGFLKDLSDATSIVVNPYEEVLQE